MKTPTHEPYGGQERANEYLDMVRVRNWLERQALRLEIGVLTKYCDVMLMLKRKSQ